MTYIRFTNKSEPERRKSNGCVRVKNCYNKAIYTEEYPPRVKKSVYKQSECGIIKQAQADFALDEAMVGEDSLSGDVSSCRKENCGNGFVGFFGAVLSTVLLLVAVYISKIEVPGYVEKYAMCLVEYAENITEKYCKDDKAEEMKIIGGKILVGAESVFEKCSGYVGSVKKREDLTVEEENSNFAESVIENSNNGEGVYVEKLTENTDAIPVIARNMSYGSDRIYSTDRSGLDVDCTALSERNYPIGKIALGGASEPEVLIIHTHGTEAYINTGENGKTRSNDTDKNVVRVGKELSDVLESYGIGVIHSHTMHDEISYVKAYENSKREAQKYLSEYPSIKYVIDVHRDALASQGETPVKTYAEINGDAAAQLMFVMGTNAGGGNHPDYLNNLTVVCHMQKKINQLFPSLMRPVNIRPMVFNQNLVDGCMILEVGSDANTLEEALTAVRMFGRCFAEVAGGNGE